MKEFQAAFRRVPVNISLILCNILVFLLVEVTGGSQNTMHMVECGALYLPLVMEEHAYYRLGVSMFLHFGLGHLANNMLLLYVLGGSLERALGKVRYVLLYLIGGLGGNVLSCYLEWRKGEFAVSAGASGAVFAVMGGLLAVLLLRRGRLEELTTQKLLIMAGLSLYYGFVSTGVDNAAHVGGLLCGLLLAVLMFPGWRRRCGKVPDPFV